MAHPYRPFTGERVAPLDPLQKFAQEQAKAVHAREKGMSELYNKSAQAIEGTLGERSLDTMKPYLDAGLKDPSTEWERFRSPHDREFEGIKEQLERNLTEHILPAINSRYSVRSGHRNKFTQRALRDFSESLNKEKSALMERDIRDAKKMAAEYAARQLNAAQMVGGTHTTDVSRVADTAKALHGLGSREQERTLQGANTLANIGAQNQAQRQQEINAAINAHKEAQEHGLRVRALGTSIVGGLPVNESVLNVMQPAQTASPNPATQIGALVAAAGALNYANPGRSPTYKGGSIRNRYKNGGRARFEEGGAVGGNPFQRGVDNALESIRRHKDSLERLSRDADVESVNPIWPWLAKTALGVAGSKNPNVLQAIGESGFNAFDTYENTIKQNMLQKERAANIHAAIIKTHQIEEANRVKNQIKLQNSQFDQLYKNNYLDEIGRHHRAMEAAKAGNMGGNGILGGEPVFKVSDKERENLEQRILALREQKNRVVEAKEALEKAGPTGEGMDGWLGTTLTVLDPKSSLAARQKANAKTMEVVLKDEFLNTKGTTNQKKHEDFKSSKAGLDKQKEANIDLLNTKERDFDARLQLDIFKQAADNKLPKSVYDKVIRDWHRAGSTGDIFKFVPAEWRGALDLEVESEVEVEPTLAPSNGVNPNLIGKKFTPEQQAAARELLTKMKQGTVKNG